MASKQTTDLPFYGYVRVSRVNGRSGDSYRSPEDQKKIIERLARDKGVALAGIVVEEDVSGKKKASERELEGLIARVEGERAEDGRVLVKPTSGGILVWNVKRYSRNWTDGVLTANRIMDAGGRIISEDFDTAMPFARSVLSFLLEVAQEELRQKTETWKRATDGAIHRGVVVGPTPTGYDRLPDGRVRKNSDEDAVREVFLGRAQGRSWPKLADELEAAGVENSTHRYAREKIEKARTSASITNDPKDAKTVARYEKTLAAGPGWHHNSVRSLVHQTIYFGMLQNGAAHHFPAYAIVSKTGWDAAQEKQEGAARRDRGDWALLAGMVVCGECGGPLTPQRDFKTVADGSRAEYRAYRCQDRKCRASVGKQVRANGYELDEIVVPAVLAEFARRVAEVGVGADEDLETVVALEQAVEMAEAELASFLAVAKASMPGFAEGVESRSADVEAAKAALIEETAKTRRFPSVEEVEAVLAGSDIEARREAVRRVLLEVVVSSVGTRLKDAFRQADGEALDFTAPEPGPECYEESKALADRVETTWK
jgi:DNA invertase Pin-like site-specific DNA recombinase